MWRPRELLIALGVFVTAAFATADEQWAGDAFYADWIGRHLRALQEPLLHERTSDGEVYRMTVLPSFGHPVSVRVVAANSSAIVRMTDGDGGYDAGTLKFAELVAISKADVGALRAAFQGVGFWTMPTITPRREVVEPNGTVEVWVCADGPLFVLEALAADGRYHMIHRNCSSTDDLSAVVSVFKRIAGRHLPKHLK